MLDSSGDTPAIAALRLVMLSPNEQPHTTHYQVAGLLVDMGMARQDSAFAQPKLGHHRVFAENQCFPLNPVRDGTAPVIASLCEHG